MAEPSRIQMIEDFLAQKRIAIVGLSRDERHFSRHVAKVLTDNGFEILPVNKLADTIGDIRSYQQVADIKPSPDAAIMMTPAASLEAGVRDCVEAGIRKIWLVNSPGSHKVRRSLEALYRKEGITIIEGACPLMYLPKTPLFHRMHGWVWRAIGRWGH
jgi:uncharacterized protein